jgi:hypothetical protein
MLGTVRFSTWVSYCLLQTDELENIQVRPRSINMARDRIHKGFIFFVTYERPKAEVLNWSRLRRFDMGKHSSLLGPIKSYEEKEVLRIQPQYPTIRVEHRKY